MFYIENTDKEVLDKLDLAIEDKCSYSLLRVTKPERTLGVRIPKEKFGGYGPGDQYEYLALFKAMIQRIQDSVNKHSVAKRFDDETEETNTTHNDIYPVFELIRDNIVFIIKLTDKKYDIGRKYIPVIQFKEDRAISEYHQIMTKYFQHNEEEVSK